MHREGVGCCRKAQNSDELLMPSVLEDRETNRSLQPHKRKPIFGGVHRCLARGKATGALNPTGLLPAILLTFNMGAQEGNSESLEGTCNNLSSKCRRHLFTVTHHISDSSNLKNSPSEGTDSSLKAQNINP